MSIGALCDTPDFILIEKCEVSEQVELAKIYGMPAVRPSGVCNLVQLEVYALALIYVHVY